MRSVSFLALALALVSVVFAQSSVSFSGNAKNDFLNQRDVWHIETVVDPSITADVGVPPQLPANAVSGWDIEQIFFQYNPENDELLIGIDCFSICGDADGDGNPDMPSAALVSIGGEDTSDLEGLESFAITIDWNGNLPATPDTIIGIPGGNPTIGDPLSCASSSNFGMGACFGIYAAGTLPNVPPAFQFVELDSSFSFFASNSNPSPSNARPDLEWTVGPISLIKETYGSPFDISRFEEWDFTMQAFAGSFVDAGIGEDYIPEQGQFVRVPFPCQQFDDCGICLGDGSSCLDCAGVPNGGNDYDACDVCGGNSDTCLDCAGTPNGAAVYDECDVCNGNGDTCIPDCLGVPGGVATYDVCGICGGDGSACADCLGISLGTATYDACGICAGDGSSCADCLGVPNGAATYDVCGVCAGDGQGCFDCFGTPNGIATYDICDICGGNGDTCLDCKGIPLGPHTYDICGVCGGDGTSCLDCNGKPFGCARLDICDVCAGDGTSCLDCAGIPFGPHVYSKCGDCVLEYEDCAPHVHVAVPQAPHHLSVHDYVYTDDDDDDDHREYTSLNYYDNHGHASNSFHPYPTDHSPDYGFISPGNHYDAHKFHHSDYSSHSAPFHNGGHAQKHNLGHGVAGRHH